MAPDVPDDRVASRAASPPEDQAGQGDGVDRHAAAAEIMRDSDQRVVEATQSNAPGDAADEHP